MVKHDKLQLYQPLKMRTVDYVVAMIFNSS